MTVWVLTAYLLAIPPNYVSETVAEYRQEHLCEDGMIRMSEMLKGQGLVFKLSCRALATA